MKMLRSGIADAVGHLLQGFAAQLAQRHLPQRDGQLFGERALHLLGDLGQRRVQAEAGLDAGRDQVEGVRQALEDIVLAVAHAVAQPDLRGMKRPRAPQPSITSSAWPFNPPIESASMKPIASMKASHEHQDKQEAAGADRLTGLDQALLDAVDHAAGQQRFDLPAKRVAQRGRTRAPLSIRAGSARRSMRAASPLIAAMRADIAFGWRPVMPSTSTTTAANTNRAPDYDHLLHLDGQDLLDQENAEDLQADGRRPA